MMLCVLCIWVSLDCQLLSSSNMDCQSLNSSNIPLSQGPWWVVLIKSKDSEMCCRLHTWHHGNNKTSQTFALTLLVPGLHKKIIGLGGYRGEIIMYISLSLIYTPSELWALSMMNITCKKFYLACCALTSHTSRTWLWLPEPVVHYLVDLIPVYIYKFLM